jgi:hypothetical protein
MCELTARHGRGTAWAWHAVCESTFTEPRQILANVIKRFKVKAALNVKITILWNVPASTLGDRHQSSKQPVVSIFREKMMAEVSFEKVLSF